MAGARQACTQQGFEVHRLVRRMRIAQGVMDQEQHVPKRAQCSFGRDETLKAYKARQFVRRKESVFQIGMLHH
jgi:hypothetical protein